VARVTPVLPFRSLSSEAIAVPLLSAHHLDAHAAIPMVPVAAVGETVAMPAMMSNPISVRVGQTGSIFELLHYIGGNGDRKGARDKDVAVVTAARLARSSRSA